MTGDILAEFSVGDVNQFKKDFIQLIKVWAEIDRYYGEAQPDIDNLIPKFEKLLVQFNRKYKGLRVKSKKLVDSYRLRIFVDSNDVKMFFSDSASKIQGLLSVGKTNFGQQDANDSENLRKFLNDLKESIYLSYASPETGSGTIAANYSKKEKMIELVYNTSELMNETSPEFKVSAFYALKGGYDKKIDVYSDASAFGFSNLLDEDEKRQWQDRFNPGFLE